MALVAETALGHKPGLLYTIAFLVLKDKVPEIPVLASFIVKAPPPTLIVELYAAYTTTREVAMMMQVFPKTDGFEVLPRLPHNALVAPLPILIRITVSS